MLRRAFSSGESLVTVRRFAEAVRHKAKPLIVHLEASEDLQCRNLLCEKVGDPCMCRLSHVLESLQDVRQLVLAGNGLTSLPDSVWKLQRLTLLDLARNKLASLPAEAALPKDLEVLDLEGNDGLGELQVSFPGRTKVLLPRHLRSA